MFGSEIEIPSTGLAQKTLRKLLPVQPSLKSCLNGLLNNIDCLLLFSPFLE